MPEAVKKEALRELDRLAKMPVGRGRVHRLAHLPRLARRAAVAEADRRSHRSAARPSRSLDADHSGLEKAKDRILEYLAVRKLNPEREGPDSLLCGTARRRQDLAGAIDRAVARPQVRARLARRHARRGGDPRAPAHLHRRAARPDHPGSAPRRVEEPGVHPRRDRQARNRLPRRPGVGAARGARSGAEQRVPRSLPRRAVRPVGGAVHHDRERARSDSASAARSHGGARDSRLHRGREACDRARSPGPETDHEPRPDARAADHHRRGAAGW